MSRIKKVNWTNNPPEDNKKLLEHNEASYIKVILQNYLIYNSEARLDIANLLYNQWKIEVKEHPTHLASQHNLFVEIYSKLIQVSEDLALVALILLGLRPVVETYMESTNGNILDFYERAFKGFSDKEMVKILGMKKLKEYINSNANLSDKERNNINSAIDNAIVIERKNLKTLANIYFDQVAVKESGKFEQGGPIDVYNSIKHGYKFVHPTKLAKKLWQDIDEKSVNLMHRVIYDEVSNKKIIALGGFERIDNQLMESIMHNINFYSNSLHHITETKLLSDVNPMYVVKTIRLAITKDKLQKGTIVKHYSRCLCGSGSKYKKCCGLFENQYIRDSVFEKVDI